MMTERQRWIWVTAVLGLVAAVLVLAIVGRDSAALARSGGTGPTGVGVTGSGSQRGSDVALSRTEPSGNDAAGEQAPQQLRVPTGEHRVEVVDASGAPIAGARVSVASGVCWTDGEGLAMVADDDFGGYALVRAPGRVPCLGPLADGRVVMQRAGRLVCRVADEHGAPVPGVKVSVLIEPATGSWSASGWRELIAPGALAYAVVREDLAGWLPVLGSGDMKLVGGRLSEQQTARVLVRLDTVGGQRTPWQTLRLGSSGGADVLDTLLGAVALPAWVRPQLGRITQTTDGEGKVVWDEFAAGTCRVALWADAWRDPMDPRCQGGGVLRTGDWSMPIETTADRPTVYHLCIPSSFGGRVLGRIPTPDPVRARITLQRRAVRLDAGGKEVNGLEEVATCVPRNGYFEFIGVPAGEQIVRACWVTREQEVCFASALGSLQEGTDLDLGELVPKAGPVVEVSLGVKDVAGCAFHPLPEALATARVHLFVMQLDDSKDLALSLCDHVDVGLPSLVRLVGCEPGDLDLDLRWLGSGPPAPRGLRVVMPEGRECKLPVAGRVNLDVRLLQNVDCELLCSWPAGLVPRGLRVLALGNGGSLSQVRVEAAGGRIRLPEDVTALWIDSSESGLGVDGGVFAHVTDLRLAERSGGLLRIRIGLEAGVVVQGRVVGTLGSGARKLVGGRLVWRLPSHGDVCYSVRVADDGTFRLEGLPRNATLIGARGVPPIETGATGRSGIELR